MCAANNTEFVETAVMLVDDLEVAIAEAGGLFALPGRRKRPPNKQLDKKLQELNSANELIKSELVKERICQSLNGFTGDARDIAAILAVYALEAGQDSVIPLVPIAIAAVAVVLMRMGVKFYCPCSDNKSS